MYKAAPILLSLLLFASKCVSQNYMKFSLETNYRDHLYPNFVILTNKNDYKATKQDFFKDFRIFKINKRKFTILEQYAKGLMAKIHLDSNYKKFFPRQGEFEVEIVSDSLNSQDFLNSVVFPNFFAEIKEKLISIGAEERLISAMDTCQKQY